MGEFCGALVVTLIGCLSLSPNLYNNDNYININNNNENINNYNNLSQLLVAPCDATFEIHLATLMVVKYPLCTMTGAVIADTWKNIFYVPS